MNDLTIRKNELQRVLNKDETDKCHLLSVFMDSYNKKKDSYIRKKKKKIKSIFKNLYSYKLKGKTKCNIIENMSLYEAELLNYLLDVYGVYDLKTIISKSIPFSFLLSTLSVVAYFYIFPETIAGVFLLFYVSAFLLLLLSSTLIKSEFINKRKYEKIFKINLNSYEAENFMISKFNQVNFLQESELNLLKKIIERKDFLEILKRKGRKICYSDILPIVKKEYSLIVSKIENYHLNELYEEL